MFRRYIDVCLPSGATGLESSSYGQLPPSLEVELLQLAAEGDVPVPEIHCVLGAEDGLGDGYIMEWLEGETMGQRIIKLPELADARESLAFECGQALARIHALPVSRSLSEKLHSVSPEALVRETWDAYIALDTPQPMIDYTAQWLLAICHKIREQRWFMGTSGTAI